MTATEISNNLKSNNVINQGTHSVSWLSIVICFIAGGSLVLAFAPFSIWPIPFIAIIAWLSQLQLSTAKQAFKLGLSFGFGYFAFGISWVHVSIEQFGGMPLIFSLLLMLLLCAYLALYPALCVFLTSYVSSRLTANHSPIQINLYYLPFFWLLSEWLRSVLLTGFPWLSLGYSQIDSPLASLAPLIGEVGITFVMMQICVSALAIIKGRQRAINACILILLAALIFACNLTSFVTTTGNNITTALVQGNIKQELRWDEKAEQEIMDQYVTDSEALFSKNDLVIWPEAAIPRIEPLAQGYLRELNQSVGNQNSSLVTGIINYDPDTRQFFNSLIVLGNKHKQALQSSDANDISVPPRMGNYYYGNANHYNKHHLLPIGEFVPFGDLLRPLAPFFNLPMSSFSRGDYVQKNLVANDIHIAPLICFEIVFPKQLLANMREHTDVILTVSNDAWFGDSHGPHQHLEIARMRALEVGKPMLRATNNGLTAVIDHRGVIIADVPQFSQSVLQTKVNTTIGSTPFVLYGRYFDTLMILIFGLFVFIKFITKSKP